MILEECQKTGDPEVYFVDFKEKELISKMLASQVISGLNNKKKAVNTLLKGKIA